MAQGELISHYSTLVMFIVAGAIAEILPLTLQIVASSAPSQIALPNCPTKCGDVSVPYPFGIGDNCHYNHSIDGRYYNLTCNYTCNPPRLIYGEDIEVVNITLDGEIQVLTYLAYACYNISGYQISRIKSHTNMKRFTISTTSNSLVGIGCDTYVWFEGTGIRSEVQFQSGCMTMCNTEQEDYVGELSDHCSGVGCCLANIPEGVNNITIRARSFNNHTLVYDFNPCSIASVVAKNAKPFFFNHLLHQNMTNLESLNKNPRLPMVFDWSIGTNSCTSARAASESEPICRGHSRCLDSPNGWGYRCQCKPRFKGNPYLHDCQDVDECEGVNDCEKAEYCINTDGGYYCRCLKGYHGNGTKSDRCVRDANVWLTPVLIAAGLGASLGSILLLLVGWWLHLVFKKRKIIKQREINFEKNGGILLQQQMSSNGAIVERINILTIDELQKATDNFNEDRILGQGGHGTVYKGMLGEGRIVAVKKSNKVEESQLGEFINEVVILSQINHRNIVKLLGCCLETEVPLLVYEFIPNGTLFHHIHSPCEEFTITWKMRLQIASDSAGALAYLHSSSSKLIFHRDIKSSNILLDDKYRAKLSDFGTSRSVAIDQTHVVTRVMGTFGYMDPEYFQSHQFTEKSDVYSFGVVLVELLTGQKAVRAASEQDRSLTSWFLSHMENSCVLDIVDSQVLQEGSKEEFLTIANLAKRCLNMDGKCRPTMKEVLLEIEAVLSLHIPHKSDPKRSKLEHVFVGTSNSSQYSSSFNLESATNSAEISLLFNPR